MKLLLPALLSLAVLSGCSRGNDTSCGSQDAANIIGNHVKTEAKRRLLELGDSRIGGPRFEERDIDKLLANFAPSLVSARTVQSDPGIDKKSCTSILTFKFPAQNKADADKGTQENNIALMDIHRSETNDFGVYATRAGMSYSDGLIGDALNYTVQPTDDGKELYVEFSKVDQITRWISQFSSAVLIGRTTDVRSAFGG